MKKTAPKTMDNRPIIYAIVSTLVILFVSEWLFAFPSRLFVENTKNDITREEQTVSTGETMCTEQYDPVCGADGKTYPNACFANNSSTIIAYDGECGKSETGSSLPEVISEETSTGVAEKPSLDTFATGAFHIYENKSLGYTLALPKYAYYQGFGARDGANHALAVGLTATGVEDIATAPVQIYFYRSAPASSPAGKEVKLENGVLYIVTSGTDAKIQKIVDTVEMSAR